MNFTDRIKAKLLEWKLRALDYYNEKIVKKWYKAWSVWAAGAAFFLPDLVAWATTNWDVVSTLIPTMDSDGKDTFRKWLVAGILLFRILKQKNMPKETIPVVNVSVPDHIDLGTAGAVDVEIQRKDPPG